ncbi:MAG: hypothetical protein A3G33_07410 [Omnitrophica bacterium RIFCSPLOWO2_12_FULL_44_17]|uniref:Acriflavin resistance protein n=1 Tax=Candidatus Danuiimicrobium aquiferis TaxID=1801832 RepID=A0A1G1KYV4_9BACT|nr:MAG: hypothetical protein A3B72_07710 [Omnitrophica bacterium RIFCSPHIGHO2_02_FULL_45_28]OGW88466.1 MAG: hypothetical protein A3E74_06675 [Omnitrophica bacterium RIFCSPHIGHO2_12_FULL_44_12]OGW98051.1 MAG: hypothetical protein A3G33_07410 [Omnitrophica bacterium RIFCSPLOWO2_12_FULL_44_17]OGX03506.1 MAG: hypothetical protein A3J12_02820 [Omnitrophica bacterium RIFCSPLOWO2_02_FULL_44_11]
MNIPQFSIDRRVTTIMLMAAIVFMGIIALTSLPQELFPKISFPQITVVSNYVNAAPEEIETLITRPLEEAISSTSGLRRLESMSQEGVSTIFATFGWNENVDFAALAVREKIDLVKERLPKEAEDPIVLKFDPLAKPVMMLSITGKAAPSELKQMADQILKENLEKVEGVASVRVSGGLDREIQVELDQGGLRNAEVSILEVIDAIDNANVSYPAGGIKKGLYEFLIRTVGEFRSVREIAYTVITTDVQKKLQRQTDTFMEKGDEGIRSTIDSLREERSKNSGDRRLVMVGDIAEIVDGFHEKTTISRYNGKENISLTIQKQGSANTVQVVDRVKEELEFLQDDLDSRGITVEMVYDQSKFIKQAIANVRDSSIQGGILAAIVLFLFFWDWTCALIVAVSIPISVVGTFFFFQLQGITLNMMSLFGLALGGSSVIDNGICVIENIFRLREQGKDAREAAVEGASDLFWPIFTGSATTIAVFFPMILFVPGVAGQLFQDLSWAVIYTTVIAFVVSMTLVPMLSVFIAPPKPSALKMPVKIDKNKIKNYILNLDRKKQNRLFRGIVGIGIGFFIVALLILRGLDTEIVPRVDQGQFMVKVNLPVGSRIETTDEVAKIIEQEVNRIPEVENIQVTIGSAQSSKIGDVNVSSLRSHQALIMIKLKKERRRPSSAVVAELRKLVDAHRIEKAEIEYVLQESDFEFAAGGGKPVMIEVKGYDLGKLTTLSHRVEKMLREIPGTADVLSDLGAPSPETKVEIDRKRAALYAISARDVALTSKAAIEGTVATEYKEGGREIDVRVRLRLNDRQDVSKLGDMLVRSHSLEVPVMLKEIGTITQGFGPSEIRRKDQMRTITISAAVEKGFKEKDVLLQAQKAIDELELTQEYTVELVGKAREIKESFQRVNFATTLAIILNYMLMAAQFESFLHPFIIILTVPFSLFGVAMALWMSGTTINIIALLGVLILVGTGTNSAIVLIDFINQSRREGSELVSACVDASFIRFRAITMSMLTAVVGLIPLALGIGEGSELQAPLAVTMIGGYAWGTVCTLTVIPSLYILLTRAIDRLFYFEEQQELEQI